MASQLIDFINASWTPWHAVEEASKRLLAAGFEHISEAAEWSLKPGGRYFFTRNMSTVVAFAVGEKYQPGNGFYMVGAHTDSPCLKLKPVSKSSRAGCLMVNVETYGGGLWYTWFDRDLGVAGGSAPPAAAASAAAAAAIVAPQQQTLPQCFAGQPVLGTCRSRHPGWLGGCRPPTTAG
jgi:aspartyl aminopeptidase